MGPLCLLQAGRYDIYNAVICIYTYLYLLIQKRSGQGGDTAAVLIRNRKARAGIRRGVRGVLEREYCGRSWRPGALWGQDGNCGYVLGDRWGGL